MSTKTSHFKNTEIGPIPEDWEVKAIGDILKIRHGKDQKQVVSDNGSYPIYGTGGLMGWAKEYLCDKPSVLIGRKGTIDKPRYVDVPFWTVDTLFYSEIASTAIPIYVFNQFQLIDWYKYNEASGVPSLNAKTIESILIPLPPLPEQTAIAAALSDMDALMAQTQKLLQKKKAIKQGVMQELLIGRKRLQGFAQSHAYKNTALGLIPEDWEVKEIGAILKIRHGKDQKQVLCENGCYPIFGTGGQMGWAKEFLYDKPSVLIGRKGTIDKPRYIEVPFWTVDTLYYSEILGIANPFFVFNQFQLIDWYRYNEASGVPSLNAKTIEAIPIPLPPLPEQTAIAEAISAMDEAIAAIETKLHKLRQQKQGMMQVLLTGQIRLV
jgi:type I restriction enzyme, S subunit